MNSVQRKFLIDKLQEKSNLAIRSLEQEKKAYPSASNYLYRAVLNGTIEIASKETIIKALTERALKAKEGENWLEPKNNNFRSWSDEKERNLELSIRDLIIVPDDYDKEYKKIDSHNKLVEEKIKTLKIQIETLILRIQLASDKNLEKMIGEVDDMGDLSLIDTKIKLLN